MKLIKKEDFLHLKQTLEGKIDEYTADSALLSMFDDFILDYEDEEIDVVGYYENEVLVGMVRSNIETVDYLLENGDDLEITLIGTLFVHPDYRNKGIARKLVDYALENAETDTIVADPYDLDSQRFFLSIGFDFENELGDDDEWLLYKKV